MNRILSFLILVLLFSSCSNKFSKIVKSKDFEYKHKMADKYYEAKNYNYAQQLYEDIFPFIKKRGKFSIVDVYLELALTHRILGFDHTGSKLVDVGRTESIAVAEKLFQ